MWRWYYLNQHGPWENDPCFNPRSKNVSVITAQECQWEVSVLLQVSTLKVQPDVGEATTIPVSATASPSVHSSQLRNRKLLVSTGINRSNTWICPLMLCWFEEAAAEAADEHVFFFSSFSVWILFVLHFMNLFMQRHFNKEHLKMFTYLSFIFIPAVMLDSSVDSCLEWPMTAEIWERLFDGAWNTLDIGIGLNQPCLDVCCLICTCTYLFLFCLIQHESIRSCWSASLKEGVWSTKTAKTCENKTTFVR